jgi:ATP-dependent Clp protease ATP-binding subunit ClpA
MISTELEVSLHLAFVEARQQRHEKLTVEHMLLALLDNPSAQKVLKVCHADIESLRLSLITFMKEHLKSVDGEKEVDVLPTHSLQRVIQRAIMTVETRNTGAEVTGADMLLSITGEREYSYAMLCIQQLVTKNMFEAAMREPSLT